MKQWRAVDWSGAEWDGESSGGAMVEADDMWKRWTNESVKKAKD